jgi:hypothetical protein
MQEAASSGRRVAEITVDDVTAWLRATLEYLGEVAEEQHVERGELACTALLAILGERAAVFAQIGDGAWVARRQGLVEVVTWPLTGEYANQTKFITSPDALQCLQFKKCEGPLDGVGGFTDGVQSLALRYADKTAHGPFFEPMFTGLKCCEDSTSLKGPLMAFLSSEVVNERTDDDKTLVIAHRCSGGICGDAVC